MADEDTELPGEGELAEALLTEFGLLGGAVGEVHMPLSEAVNAMRHHARSIIWMLRDDALEIRSV